MKKKFQFSILIVFVFTFITNAQEFSISIDAQKDVFYESLTGPSDGLVYLPARCFLSEIGSGPTDDQDLSAKVWFSYDEDYLYCYAEVKDEIVAATNSSRFQNDCIELKFDPDPNSGTGSQTSNCRLTAKGADDAEDPNGVDNLNGSGHLEDVSGADLVTTPDDYARMLTNYGYIVEFRVPFTFINEPQDNRFMIDRIVGGVFGMSINIGDNDGTARDNMIQWSAGHADAAHSDAKLEGSVTFLAGHKIKLEAVSPRDPSVVNDSADVWYLIPNTSIEIESITTRSYQLLANYPNPFNPTTTIKFSIPNQEFVSLKIYNNLGQEVAQLVSENLKAGVYTIQWNATNFVGGVYYCRITTGKYTETNKLVLLK